MVNSFFKCTSALEMSRENNLELSPLTALSPLDGRYSTRVGVLRNHFSEFGLIRYRVMIEIRWLAYLAAKPRFSELSPCPVTPMISWIDW
ncbi:MAG: hypothetical protein Ct9H300mP13_8520 [Gammaproteobacteria bacterium]|nr:MAG: hypothetical protein Ct9H300mP13_8520 [Gammaproteobacteria bacterium]